MSCRETGVIGKSDRTVALLERVGLPRKPRSKSPIKLKLKLTIRGYRTLWISWRLGI